MPRVVHISAIVVLLVAIASSDPQEGITIHIKGPTRIIIGSPGESTTQEGHEVPTATAEQCTGEDGFCVETGDRCNGTIKNLHLSCNDHCACCVPNKQVGCPEAEGFFSLPGSSQCFKPFLDHPRSWTESDAICKEAGLELAKPDNVVELQKYLYKTYDEMAFSSTPEHLREKTAGPEEIIIPGMCAMDHSCGHGYYVGGRTDGYDMRWVRGGEVLEKDSPLWWRSPRPEEFGTNYCLGMQPYDFSPGKPYFSEHCGWGGEPYALCEVVQE